MRVLATMMLLATSTLSAQPVDTTAMLRVVGANMRMESARADSTDQVGCRARGAPSCPQRFVQHPTWYLDAADSTTLGVRLAQIDSTVYRVDARTLPPCPWPASAPAGAGYRARVSIDVESASRATVIVYLSCDNPPGYMHDLYVLEREYELERSRETWVVKSVTIRAS